MVIITNIPQSSHTLKELLELYGSCQRRLDVFSWASKSHWNKLCKISFLKRGHSMPNQRRIVRTPLRFWRNLVCLECLWCLSLIPIFSCIHHIVSDLWPQTFWIFHKKIGLTWVTKSSSLCNFATKISVIKEYRLTF